MKDEEFVGRVEGLLESQSERYSNVSLLKYTLAVMYHDPTNPKYREMLLRKLRTLNPEMQSDLRLISQALWYLVNLEAPLPGEPRPSLTSGLPIFHRML